MTFKVIAEAEAKREWNEAVDWYEERETGVGWRFDDELRTFLQTLAQNPERFQLFTRLAIDKIEAPGIDIPEPVKKARRTKKEENESGS